MKIIFRTATVFFNVNIFFFFCHSGNFNAGKQYSIGFFVGGILKLHREGFPFPFYPVCLFTSKFKNKLIDMKGTKFFLKEVWVCLFCLFCSLTILFSWRTTSVYILSKAFN